MDEELLDRVGGRHGEARQDLLRHALARRALHEGVYLDRGRRAGRVVRHQAEPVQSAQ
jgi:hypothetical protein